MKLQAFKVVSALLTTGSILSGCGVGFVAMDVEKSQYGSSTQPPRTTPSVPGEKACVTTNLVSGGARRMNAREYINSVKNLLGNAAIEKSELPPDSKNLRDFDTDGSGLHILDLDADKYFAVIERATESVFAAGKSPAFVSCSLDATQNGVTAQQCFDSSLQKLLTRAFRKEASSAVVSRFTMLASAESTPRAKLKLATQAILLSPEFLYLNANAGQAVGALNDLNSYQVAERLSFFLWSSVPDEALMAAAKAGSLKTKDGIKAQVSRMMADARFSNFFDGFFNQWLKLENLPAHTRDVALFPEYKPELLTSMANETRAFLTHIIGQNRPINEILTADYSFVDQRLAQYYGIAGVSSTQLTRVTLPPQQRRGILTQGAVLTVTGRNASATAPVRRGVFVLKKLSCKPPAPPPPDIPGFPEDPPTGAEMTAKQKMARHRTSGACMSCHSSIDPPGIGLENFDNFGKWRTKYSPTLDVDSSEVFEGIPFTNPAELVTAIAQKDEFESCLAETVAGYALGRVPSFDDKCHAENLVIRVQKSGGSFADLITEFVASDFFQREIGD